MRGCCEVRFQGGLFKKGPQVFSSPVFIFNNRRECKEVLVWFPMKSRASHFFKSPFQTLQNIFSMTGALAEESGVIQAVAFRPEDVLVQKLLGVGNSCCLWNLC